jgi:hypothetical protein
MSLLQSGPRLVARSMETTTKSDVSIGREVEPGNGKKMFTGSDVDVFIDGTRIGRVTPVALEPFDAAKANAFERMITSITPTEVLRPPSHWPPRITRLCLSVRLGITRLLLERRL